MSEAIGQATLLRKTAQGAGWVIAWRLGTRAIGLVSTLILARLLVPADFGLVAIGTTFTTTVEMMTSIGIEESVVREKQTNRALYDTAFTLALLRGAGLALVIALLAWPAAGFFGDPRLALILFALAFGTLAEGATNIGVVEFRRALDFRREFMFWITPRLVGSVITIGAAFALRSYWALVFGILLQRGLRVAFSYQVHPYRPRLSLVAWRGIAGYSLWSWAVSVAAILGERADTVVVGRLLGPAELGAFAAGAELAHLPTTELVEPLGRAAFSGFAGAMHAGLAPGEAWLRIVSFVALLALPAGVGISLIGAPIVALALGPAWSHAAPVVQVLGIAGALTLFGRIGAALFSAHGRLAQLFGLATGAAMLRVGLLLALVPSFGLTGAAVAAGAAVTAEQLLTLAITMRNFAVRPAALLRATGRTVFATAAMTAALWGLGLGWAEPANGAGALAQQVIGSAALGATIYGVVLFGAWLACGRPEGAERDGLTALARVARRLRD